MAYPADIPTLTTVLDVDANNSGGTDINATLLNAYRTNITATQTELGVDPAGAYATVVLRLDAMDTSVTGYLPIDGSGAMEGNLDLDGYDLLLDTDGDSYLHESADDVIDLVLAGASGEFAIHVNGAEDFKFTANSFNVLAGSAVLISTSDGVDYTPAADGDVDIATVNVTGTPTLKWDESEDAFSANKGLQITDGNLTVDDYFSVGENAHTTVSLGGVTKTVQIGIHGDDVANKYCIYADRGSDTHAPAYILARARGSHASPTQVANNDRLGTIGFMGWDGTDEDMNLGALIFARVDGTAGNDDLPTELVFSTTADGAASPTERVIIGPTGLVSANYGMNVGGGFLRLPAATELTIDTNGDITATQSYHTVDTFEDGATDDLQTINGGTEGDVLIIRPVNSARTVVAKDYVGDNDNLLLAGDCSMDDDSDTLTLLYTGTYWMEISRSNNG